MLNNSTKYLKLVNFSSNLDEPKHNWFNFKEGYSKELVKNIITDLNVKEGMIFDPFSGCGTTMLTSTQLGFDFLGFEINPFLYLLSKVKSNNYMRKDIETIKKYQTQNIISERSNSEKKIKKINLKIIEKAFGNQLEIILRYRKTILSLKNEFLKNFFLVGFCSILEDCSFTRKDGNGLRYPPNKKPLNFETTFFRKINKMIADIEIVDNTNMKSYMYNNDCRNINNKILKNFEGKVSLSLFSPPYLNCFDYTEIYKLELWLGGFVNEYSDIQSIRIKTLSSHLNKKFDKVKVPTILKKLIKDISIEKIWSKKIPDMISNYFFDMEKVLKNIFKLLANKSYCVIVVGNSSYANIVVPTDEILANIAEKIGFKLLGIETARKLNTSPQQQKKIRNSHKLRESLVYLQKC